MAAPELRLRWLNALGNAKWIYRNLTFDLTMLIDPFVQPWTVQPIETGIQAAIGSVAVNKELQFLLAGGRQRTIRFFSNGQGFLSGIGATPGSGSNFGMTGASGVSLCAQRFSGEGNPGYISTPPDARTDLRMYLNPTGGTGMSLPGSDGSYHPTYSYLVGTLWHEFHPMAAPDTEQHDPHTAPPYEPRWQAAMTAMKSGFPDTWRPPHHPAPGRARSWAGIAGSGYPSRAARTCSMPVMPGRNVTSMTVASNMK